MGPEGRRQLIIGLLLGAMFVAVLLFLSGLAATLQLGQSGVRGFLLVPALPTPMYLTMLVVVLAAVGLSLLVSVLQRRRGPRSPEPQRESSAPKPFWQAMLTTLAWVALAAVGLNWLIRHGREVQSFLERIRAEVRRAMQAGLRDLREHTDPRQAIIACYARLEYLLEDHGVPAYHHLTPQEYMGAALRGLDLPEDAFAGLIRLFELARYSLHPLDEAARAAARAHLERLTAHAEGKAVHAPRC
jgi:hypothetical protein